MISWWQCTPTALAIYKHYVYAFGTTEITAINVPFYVDAYKGIRHNKYWYC